MNTPKFYEIMLPASDMEKSKNFYQNFGYEVFNEQPWGMVQMRSREGGAILSLYSSNFFKKPGLGYLYKDLDGLVKDLEDRGLVGPDNGAQGRDILMDL